jgi:hypothetical protein
MQQGLRSGHDSIAAKIRQHKSRYKVTIGMSPSASFSPSHASRQAACCAALDVAKDTRCA